MLEKPVFKTTSRQKSLPALSSLLKTLECLEREAAAQLDETGVVLLSCDLAEIRSIVSLVVWRRELGPIEDVEELTSEVEDIPILHRRTENSWRPRSQWSQYPANGGSTGREGRFRTPSHRGR